MPRRRAAHPGMKEKIMPQLPRERTGHGLLTVGLVAVLLLSCGRRPPPPPPLPPPSGTVGRTTDARDASVPKPLIDAVIEPASIRKGESAMLSWSSRHAESVEIGPGIGNVDLSGRIKFFPDETTTYILSATGPGGREERSVTIVVDDTFGVRAGEVTEIDLREEPLVTRFEAAVRPVFFRFDSAELTAEAQAILDTNFRWLSRPQNSELRFVLEGHTDDRGSEEYNLALGDRRAEVVREYLVRKGIAPSRIETVSIGEERPFVSGSTEEAYSQNRRTEFVLLNQPAP